MLCWRTGVNLYSSAVGRELGFPEHEGSRYGFYEELGIPVTRE